MPNNTSKKNNKGKNSATKNSTNNKNVEKKNAEKRNSTKSTETKVVEKKTQVKEVETKPVEKTVVKEEKIIKKERETKNNTNSIMSNTPFVIALCIIVLLLAIVIFLAFSKRIPKVSNGNEVVATIKGKKITANDLYKSLKSDRGTNSLISLIDDYIAEKEVTKITDKDKDYVQEVVDYYKNYAEQYKLDLKTFLEQYVGLSDISTEKELFNFILDDYKKVLAVRNYIGDEATEKELKKYYEDNYSDKLTVKHILIEVDKDAKDADKADKEAKEKAEKLIKQLDKVKDDKKLESKFAELAKENSDDTATYSDGGTLKDITKKDVVEEFWKAASKLKNGKYTDKPVKTTYGYHVILRVSSTDVEKYDDIKDDVKIAYAENMLNNDTTVQTIKWDELRKKYKLSIKDDTIKEEYEDTIKEAKETSEKSENENNEK